MCVSVNANTDSFMAAPLPPPAMRLAKNSRAGSWEEKKAKKKTWRRRVAADRWGGSDLVAESEQNEKMEERRIEWS